MKQFLKIIMVNLAMVGFFASCTKLDPVPTHTNGNAVQLTSSTTTVAPTVADADRPVISFSWTNPNYATDSKNYKYVLEIDSAGRNFSHESTKVIEGKDTTSLTGRELNAILIGYGFTLGAPYNLDVRVSSSYGNNNEKYTSNTIQISVSAFNDPSTLTSDVNDVTLTLATAANPSATFSWTQSFTGYTGDITYSLEYDIAGGNFVTSHSIPVGVSVLSKTLTEGEMNQTAFDSGIPPGDVGSVEYRVKAVTALGAVSYSNTINITIHSYISILHFYMPGGYQTSTGNGTDWTPADAPELVRDYRASASVIMYYIYVYLPANAEFKLTLGRAWDINYGTGATPGSLALNGGNLSVPTAGYYRISINPNALQYNIMEGRMGFVGGSTGAGWDPPSVFPNYALGLGGTNLFVGLTTLTTGGGGWKLIDNNAWNDGSNTVGESRSYGTPLPDGSTMELNGGNFNDVAATGRYRVVWDGRDAENIKYNMSDGSIMKVVGDGITGVPAWTPLSSPLMTYAGNNIWTITLDLDANKDIKFLAGADWGALDYEDNSGQSQATGVPKKIKWEGGDNFKTPTTAGTYTITLDEGHQTVTIN